MTDVELMRTTLNRLNLTYKAAAAICDMSEVTFQRYGTISNKIKPSVWRSLLEYEARLHERKTEIISRAAALGAGAEETPKRRGRPRGTRTQERVQDMER